MILSQDANLRKTFDWIIYKYDVLGRPIYTGIVKSNNSRIGMQNQILGGAVLEGRDNTPLTANGMPYYYTNMNWGLNTLLSVTYYDSYPQQYGFNPPVPSSIMGQTVLTDTPTTDGKSTKGLPVLSLVKNIEDDGWTKTYTYYDRKGRVIGAHSINHLGGYSKTELLLDFAGMIQQSKVLHKRLATDPEKVITQTFTYDHQNRLLVHKHQIDSNPEEILVQNEYNELSQLKNKKLGGTNPSQPLQSIDYTYNIRGWNTKINDPSNLNGKLFGYEMKYSSPVNSNVAPGKFSGIITEVDWKNASEDILKRYNYSYDGLSRLKDAVYSEPNATVPFNNYYNEHLTYDLGGNIKTLKRNAFPVNGSTATQADDLVYDYTGNQLTKVTENALNDSGYEGGNNLITYDQNGNMKDMLDKGIKSIQYNYLNLSTEYTVQQSDGFGLTLNSRMNYLYRADGTKLRKTYSSAPPRGSTTTRITDYLDGFQYTYNEGGGICLECRTESAFEQQAYRNASFVFPGNPTPEWKLDFVSTAAGYYSFTENRYIYQYIDHLGNARVSFAKNSEGAPEIIDTNNYYPFGLNHISNSFSNSGFGSFYSYKYNGKELQETGLFDYGWRQYMPDLGRWNGIDQLAEAYTSTSPFAYVANNPVLMRDPDGRWMDDSGHITDTSGQTYGFLGASFKPKYATNFLGINPGDGGGGSGKVDYSLLDGLRSEWEKRGIYSTISKNGYLTYWMAGEEGDANTSEEMVANMFKIADGLQNSLIDNSFNWIQGNPIKVSQFAGMIQAGSTVAEKGLSNWNGASNITKSRIFAEIISTKLPFSAKALGTASTVLKGLGTTVGIVGLTNTAYQYSQGKISGTRAVVDGLMGVAGFFPATAWVSVGYFAITALYETYGNDGKPLF
ncbi:RHS repeat-associated protein [Chryseobacterium sp. 7]|uniref:RHS repeat-associated core domain-containing protein n=1 Tax=Chryseobacterium sp. 7 TaxID=2035214 RepID=UPI000EABD903|nr:RHS repeat-associated core domain-containing protein [Chryseobacterium sp. 7]RLJ34637.1 RHS repeat-associated protein [Chryseobacterium sp. 7]